MTTNSSTYRPIALLAVLLLPLLLWPVDALAKRSEADERIGELLRVRIEGAGIPARMIVQGEAIMAETSLPEFYLRRLYLPAWSEEGRISQHARELAELICDVGAEGLVPAHYHSRAIEALLDQAERSSRRGPSDTVLAELDLLLTDAFLILSSHFLNGRINPVTIDAEWRAKRRDADPVGTLVKALETGSIASELRGLLPYRDEYAGLRSALARYRQIAADGGWPEVPDGPLLRKGDRGERVALLRTRLNRTADLALDNGSPLFDEELDAAVRRFQRRHGHIVDGIVGPNTLSSLNITAEERVRQIEVNLERWRWLPRHLGERYVLVNIADFNLKLVEAGETTLEMRVVVGRPYRRTPVFSDRMRYLVLNPSWQVPDSIAAKDILPQVQKDPEYLSRMNFRVLQGWGEREREIDPTTVEWGRYHAKRFPYRFRQEPGPMNALGQIKFMFPNPHDVYLHDTPARDLFAKESPTFSSGCIRLERPLDLAERLLAGTPMGSREALDRALQNRSEQTVRFAAPVPIHLLYWTAWVDEAGTLHVRHDIYGRDLLLAQALEAAPPEAQERFALRWEGGQGT